MRTTVQLPDDLLRRAKKKAAAEGRTLTSLIEEGLRGVVAERPDDGRRKKRVTLPVSTATGGLMPGLDPIKFVQQVDEMDDLERLQKIDRKGR